MTKRQKQIVIGIILGDGYLQKTGKKNARLRLEHSSKQKQYIFWKFGELKNYMQDQPKILERYNPVFRKSYQYYRCQSLSSSLFGEFQKLFYSNSQKVIPKDIKKIFKNPLALAVWFMDDGYYYKRDKTAYIYLNKFSKEHLELLIETLEENFFLRPKLERKKSGNFNLKFHVRETKKLFQIIRPHIIDSMKYKVS